MERDQHTRRREPRIASARRLAVACLLVACVVGTAMAAARIASGRDAEALGQAPIRASGHVLGLYPGRTKALKVRIRNLEFHALRVTAIRVVVGSPGPGCSAKSLIVKPLRRPKVVPARSHIVVRLRARLRRWAGDGCQAARFPLTYRVRTVPA
jgi:hypothetical protein